jgi:hypothetical protein
MSDRPRTGYLDGMRKDEAEARCEQLNREHPDRATHRWFTREDAEGGWTVVRVAVGAGARPTGTAQPPKPQPPDATPGELPGGVSPWVAGG